MHFGTPMGVPSFSDGVLIRVIEGAASYVLGMEVATSAFRGPSTTSFSSDGLSQAKPRHDPARRLSIHLISLSQLRHQIPPSPVGCAVIPGRLALTGDPSLRFLMLARRIWACLGSLVSLRLPESIVISTPLPRSRLVPARGLCVPAA
jgi:hypothetical protein